MEEITKQIMALLPFKAGDQVQYVFKPSGKGKWYTKPATIYGIHLSLVKSRGKYITKYYYILIDSENRPIASYENDIFKTEPEAMMEAVNRNTVKITDNVPSYTHSPYRDKEVIRYILDEMEKRK